jgi:hypothetical protein
MKDKIPVLTLLSQAVPLGFGKPAPSGSLPGKEIQTMLQNIASPVKAWADSVLHMVIHYTRQSLHQVHGPAPAKFANYAPSLAAYKTQVIMALTSHIFSGIEAMTKQDLDHADQYNLIQATALFPHNKFVLSNVAAKETYANVLTTNGLRDFTTNTINSVASMASGTHSPDPLMKEQHHTALCLLCLQREF